MAEAAPKKGKLGKRLGLTAAGLLVGCGGALGIQYAVGAAVPPAIAKERASRPEPVEYVEVGKVTLPIVDSEGDLVSYVSVNVSLEVAEGKGEATKAELPAVLHEINMVTWRSALAQGPDGQLVDMKAAERIFVGAAKQVFGKNVEIKRVLVTSALPA